jgi:hypothetical protein
MGLTHEHIVGGPTFLPLATRCFGMMATEVPPETAAAFLQRMGERMQAAGAGLERHFPELPPGEGLVLLRRSFALIVGLWQLSWSHPHDAPAGCGLSSADFPRELAVALRALWEGTIGRRLPMAEPVPLPVTE